MVQKDEWLQAEGDCFPGKTYAEVVLEPAYEQAKAELLEPMLEVNKAHLLMLREQRLIGQEKRSALPPRSKPSTCRSCGEARIRGSSRICFSKWSMSCAARR